jgi:hypothetical protein
MTINIFEYLLILEVIVAIFGECLRNCFWAFKKNWREFMTKTLKTLLQNGKEIP